MLFLTIEISYFNFDFVYNRFAKQWKRRTLKEEEDITHISAQSESSWLRSV